MGGIYETGKTYTYTYNADGIRTSKTIDGIKLSLCLLAVILIVNSFISCSFQKSVLSVSSCDYPKLTSLKSGIIDEKLAIEWGNSPHYGNNCHVTIKEGKLNITNKQEYPKSFVMPANYGYFIGLNILYDAWVYYYPYYSHNEYTTIEPQAIATDEICAGFIPISGYHGFALTGYGSTVSSHGISKIYELKYNHEEKKWQWWVVAEFEGIPLVYYYSEEESIYVATSLSLVKVSKDFSVTVLSDSNTIKYTGANSLVKLNGSFYCGSSRGIYEYRIETGEEIWYPMDYDKYPPVSES